MQKFLCAIVVVFLGALPLRAESLRIVTDIVPVQALVAAVAGDRAVVSVLVGPADSPHDFALRPSQARGLQQADVVFWVGPELTHWLKKTLSNLGDNAKRVALSQVAGTRRLPMRGQAGAVDPHFWLDPQNAVRWLSEITRVLVETDPQNAVLYRKNADAEQARIAMLETEAAQILAPLAKRPYLVFHDSYQYLETRFGLSPLGAITSGEGIPPSASAIARARAELRAADVRCLLSGPDANRNLIDAVTEGAPVKRVMLDPLGNGVAGGYTGLLRYWVDGFAGCLAN
jgi:zinc transport system substrate-binding protein